MSVVKSPHHSTSISQKF